MKAILIDPALHAITEIEYDGSMQMIYESIDATLFDSVSLNEHRDIVYVDDEGLYKDNAYWRYGEYSQPLAGKGFVLGTNHEGESISPTITVEQLEAQIVFITVKTAIAMADELDAQNRRYMEANPDAPIIFGASAADILKDREYSGESDKG